MLDTVGPELQVVNKSENAISLKADATVILTPDQGQEATSEVLPINFAGLSKVRSLSLMLILHLLTFPFCQVSLDQLHWLNSNLCLKLFTIMKNF